MNSTVSPVKALLLAIFLVGIGFFVGYGFQSRANEQRNSASNNSNNNRQAPIVKAFHASPDSQKLALTAVFSGSNKAGVWIYDLKTNVANNFASPAGWQDYVVGWKNPDSLLVERERIPRLVADATAGMYAAPVVDGKTSDDQWTPFKTHLKSSEKLISGFYSPDGVLHLKTRREPKTIWRIEDDQAVKLDNSNNAYGQNRVTRINNKNILYTVRDISDIDSRQALFRVENGAATQISQPFEDLSWSYVAPSGKQFLIAQQGDEEWIWTLYDIEAKSIKEIKSAGVPSDVISVYWSPDEKHILGAAGDKLWLIDIPSLTCKQLGMRDSWSSDDATWIDNQNVGIAAGGKLWKVDLATGKETALWEFPEQF